ncbi:MAG: DUF4384 domain-containing protein [bacterium]|nr:DUF4384 domain-containing protein [bacterium]
MGKKYFIIIIVISMFCSCTGMQVRDESQKTVEVNEVLLESSSPIQPAWFIKPPEHDEKYAYFVSMSSKKEERKFARDEAKRGADIEFIKYCGVNIEVIEEYINKVVRKDNEETIASIGKNASSAAAEAFIRGTKPSEWYDCKYKYYENKNSKIYWVSALLISVPQEEIRSIREYAEKRRDKAAENKEKEENKKEQMEIKLLQEKIEGITKGYNTALEHEKNGEVVLALKILWDLSEERKTVFDKVYLSAQISGNNNSNNLPSMQDIEHLKDKILNGIIMKKISGDNQKILVGGKIKEPFEIEFSYMAGDKNIPIKNSPVFMFLPNLDKRVRDEFTDMSGKVKFDGQGIPVDKEGSFPVEFGLLSDEKVVKKAQYFVFLENKGIENIIGIKQEKKEFDINIATDKESYKIDEYVNFYFKASRDCYLTLVDIATSGETYVLFPNQFSQDNFIRAGQTYRIPGDNYGFKMKIEGPAGIERVKAIASIKPDPIENIFGMDFKKPFYEINTRGIKNIGVVREKLDKTIWSETIYEFKIYGKDINRFTGSRGLTEEEGQSMSKPIPSAGTEEVWDSTETKGDKGNKKEERKDNK